MTSGIGGLFEEFFVERGDQPRHFDALVHRDRQQPAVVMPRAMGLVEYSAMTPAPGWRKTRRRASTAWWRPAGSTAPGMFMLLPDASVHQPQIKAVLAKAKGG